LLLSGKGNIQAQPVSHQFLIQWYEHNFREGIIVMRKDQQIYRLALFILLLGTSFFQQTSPVSAQINSINPSPQAAVADTTPPVITVWYGTNQTFGALGTPQTWINVLGNVADPESSVTSLTYALNGGAQQTLKIGPDSRRLQASGDFNVEIDKASLKNGSNTVVISATNSAVLHSSTTVTLQYQANSVWPLPYSINWANVSNAQAALQIVDGNWSWDASGIRTVQDGYDRVLAIGDMTWTDYEILFPVTIHSLDTSAYNSSISVGPGLGVNIHWLGHTNNPVVCTLLHCGWIPTGASDWFAWKQNALGSLSIETNPPGGSSATTSRQLLAGHTYWMRARVQTGANSNNTYLLKVWENGVETEPASWTLQRASGSGNLSNGSFLLVAHYVDATFGNISVTPLNSNLTYQLSVSTSGSGSVTRQPNQSTYAPGAQVTLTANPSSGWNFVGWSGDLSGATNPALVTMNGNKTITANFAPNSGGGSNSFFLPLVIH
jgi:uncharacterized repeat protein (TIGR02543 family)